jgi:hypothetical protein
MALDFLEAHGILADKKLFVELVANFRRQDIEEDTFRKFHGAGIAESGKCIRSSSLTGYLTSKAGDSSLKLSNLGRA